MGPSLPLLPHAQPHPGLRSPRMETPVLTLLQGPPALLGKGLSCCLTGTFCMQPMPQPLMPSLGSPRSWAVASLPVSSLTGFVSPRRWWHLMSVVSAVQTRVCSPQPPCQSNVSLRSGRLTGLPAPCPSPGVWVTFPHLYPSTENMVRGAWGCLQPCAGGAGAPMAPGCQDKAGAAATLCPTHCPCWLLRGAPCLAGTWARA